MIATLLLHAFIQTAEPARYSVSVDPDLLYVHVTLTLPGPTTRLLMDSVQAQHLERGWASFIDALRVEAAGRQVHVSPAAGAAWDLPGGLPGPITVSYRVNLDFAHSPWPPGNEQAGAAFDEALYIVGRPLFITGDDQARSVVEFTLPDGWRVSTPWAQIGSDGRSFEAATVTELTRNALVLGRHPAVRLRSGPFDLELALPGQQLSVVSLIEPVLRRVLDAYLTLFPDTPDTKYLMSFFVANADDGEGFTSSASFTATEPPTADDIIIWGNFLAHELMHYWNGQRIRGSGPRTTWRWMAEGFSEYYANVTLARTGVVPVELFIAKAERHIGNYLYFATSPARQQMTLVEAGSNTTANRFGVYDGGWVVALCLDGLIRETSGDRRSLDDLMRQLWTAWMNGRPGYDLAALDAILANLTGSTQPQTVSAYVTTMETLSVAECLSRFGLRAATKGYAAEAFVFPDPQASATRAARWQTLIGRQ